MVCSRRYGCLGIVLRVRKRSIMDPCAVMVVVAREGRLRKYMTRVVRVGWSLVTNRPK